MIDKTSAARIAKAAKEQGRTFAELEELVAIAIRKALNPVRAAATVQDAARGMGVSHAVAIAKAGTPGHDRAFWLDVIHRGAEPIQKSRPLITRERAVNEFLAKTDEGRVLYEAYLRAEPNPAGEERVRKQQQSAEEAAYEADYAGYVKREHAKATRGW